MICVYPSFGRCEKNRNVIPKVGVIPTTAESIRLLLINTEIFLILNHCADYLNSNIRLGCNTDCLYANKGIV